MSFSVDDGKSSEVKPDTVASTAVPHTPGKAEQSSFIASQGEKVDPTHRAAVKPAKDKYIA